VLAEREWETLDIDLLTAEETAEETADEIDDGDTETLEGPAETAEGLDTEVAVETALLERDEETAEGMDEILLTLLETVEIEERTGTEILDGDTVREGMTGMTGPDGALLGMWEILTPSLAASATSLARPSLPRTFSACWRMNLALSLNSFPFVSSPIRTAFATSFGRSYGKNVATSLSTLILNASRFERACIRADRVFPTSAFTGSHTNRLPQIHLEA